MSSEFSCCVTRMNLWTSWCYSMEGADPAIQEDSQRGKCIVCSYITRQCSLSCVLLYEYIGRPSYTKDCEGANGFKLVGYNIDKNIKP